MLVLVTNTSRAYWFCTFGRLNGHWTATATTTITATATDPPSNFTSMHSRQVCQERNICLGDPAYLPKSKKQNKQPKNLSSPHGSGSRGLSQTFRRTDLATNRLNWPWADSVNIGDDNFFFSFKHSSFIEKNHIVGRYVLVVSNLIRKLFLCPLLTLIMSVTYKLKYNCLNKSCYLNKQPLGWFWIMALLQTFRYTHGLLLLTNSHSLSVLKVENIQEQGRIETTPLHCNALCP